MEGQNLALAVVWLVALVQVVQAANWESQSKSYWIFRFMLPFPGNGARSGRSNRTNWQRICWKVFAGNVDGPETSQCRWGSFAANEKTGGAGKESVRHNGIVHRGIFAGDKASGVRKIGRTAEQELQRSCGEGARWRSTHRIDERLPLFASL